MARVSLIYEDSVDYLRDLAWWWMLLFLLIIITCSKAKALSFTRFAGAQKKLI